VHDHERLPGQPALLADRLRSWQHPRKPLPAALLIHRLPIMTDREIVIRAQEPEDVAAIAEIATCPGVVAGRLQLPFSSVAYRRERLASAQESGYVLVAEVDGKVVGMIGLKPESSPRRRHSGGIGMAVQGGYQGRGVGTALLAAAIDLADYWLGLRRLELHVFADNAVAVHLCEKAGFVVEGRVRDFALRAGVYIDGLAMARLRPDANDPGRGASAS
jgi:putative acetyltransferase